MQLNIHSLFSSTSSEWCRRVLRGSVRQAQRVRRWSENVQLRTDNNSTIVTNGIQIAVENWKFARTQLENSHYWHPDYNWELTICNSQLTTVQFVHSRLQSISTILKNLYFIIEDSEDKGFETSSSLFIRWWSALPLRTSSSTFPGEDNMPGGPLDTQVRS